MALNPKNRVLITGPSNVSVDNLLIKLDPKQMAVRIGSVARSSDEVAHFMLDEVV